MKKLSIVCIILLSLVCAGLVSAGEYKGRAVKIKMASEDIEGDFMTTWGQKFSDEMKTWSDGKIDITVYPYGS
ncbi:MAG: C4-dicarboxylate ABC transporter substrate-binding protein, partial [Desulfobacula sp.]|nr:C4-dicarboxylate ABC transporter substrate-binding protein [Desulfobacula sp.]